MGKCLYFCTGLYLLIFLFNVQVQAYFFSSCTFFKIQSASEMSSKCHQCSHCCPPGPPARSTSLASFVSVLPEAAAAAAPALQPPDLQRPAKAAPALQRRYLQLPRRVAPALQPPDLQRPATVAPALQRPDLQRPATAATTSLEQSQAYMEAVTALAMVELEMKRKKCIFDHDLRLFQLSKLLNPIIQEQATKIMEQWITSRYNVVVTGNRRKRQREEGEGH